jgi:NitT/TauT family transport system permease protein
MTQLQNAPETDLDPRLIDAGEVRTSWRERRWGDLPVLPRRALLVLAMLGAWQVYVEVSGVSPLLIVGPVDVAKAMVEGIQDGRLVDATVNTMKILLTAMAIGIGLAAVFTTLATWTRIGEDLLVLLTSMLSQGFRTANPTVVAVGRNIGLSGWRLVRDVLMLMPAALPHTISGLKTGWAFGWRTIIAAELVFGVAGEGGGLGYFINDARYFLRTDEVLAGLVTIALIGIAFDVLFTWFERRTVVRWGMKA